MNESPKLSLSMISHELKNPLTLMYSTMQLIGCRYPEIKSDPLWDQMLFDVDYMSQLLSELSSLNSSQNLNISQVDIRQILTNLVSSFSSEILKQNKTITLKFETTQEYIEADALKIQEMLLNLIKNALEATKEGDYIEVIVRSKWKRLIFIVKDSGCGMDSERVETIFNPFVTYKVNGTGLGLAIVKNIVDAHCGVIQVHSKPSVGTKIIVILPETVPVKKAN